MNEDTTTYPVLFPSQAGQAAGLDQPSFEEAPLKGLSSPAAAAQKLEFLLADLEGDVMLCSTREQHIRAIQRIETLKDALLVLEGGS